MLSSKPLIYCLAPSKFTTAVTGGEEGTQMKCLLPEGSSHFHLRDCEIGILNLALVCL